MTEPQADFFRKRREQIYKKVFSRSFLVVNIYIFRKFVDLLFIRLVKSKALEIFQIRIFFDILDAGGQALVTKEDALEQAFSRLRERPRMVVTDSQAFEQVAAVTPQDVPLTSFSILFARHGGVLKQATAGAAHIDDLRDGDTVLISEGCTHHRK